MQTSQGAQSCSHAHKTLAAPQLMQDVSMTKLKAAKKLLFVYTIGSEF